MSIAINELTVMINGGTDMLNQAGNNVAYDRVFSHAFTGFPKDVGFNNGLSAPQSDFVEGLNLQEFDPFPVHRYVSGAVLFKDYPNSLTLLHVAGEWKGRGKKMD